MCFPAQAGIQAGLRLRLSSLSTGGSAAVTKQLGAVESWIPASAAMARLAQNAVLSSRVAL
jgi:hypothetical protein